MVFLEIPGFFLIYNPSPNGENTRRSRLSPKTSTFNINLDFHYIEEKRRKILAENYNKRLNSFIENMFQMKKALKFKCDNKWETKNNMK